MPLALILVDALSAAYVSRALFSTICDLTAGGFAGPLANLYAYRGIEATLFTGRFPADHGIWGEFRPAPPKLERWPDRLARLAIETGDRLPFDRLRLDVRYAVARVRHSDRLLPTGNLIPADLMPRFIGSVEQPIWETGSLGEIRTLFDELRATHMSFAIVSHPIIHHDHQIEPYVRALLARGVLPNFWYIKFSALDALGHFLGPSVTKLAPALRTLNGQLAALITTLKSAYPNGGIDIVILSDHGMSWVKSRIDIRPFLKQVQGDFLYFLDSTTLRFWSTDPHLCATLKAQFASVSGLQILDLEARHSLQIPDDISTGDVLIALEEGKVIFPDFFRRESPPLGMHGYASVETEAGLPFLAVDSEIAACLPDRRPLTHADVWSAMRQRLGLGQPA